MNKTKYIILTLALCFSLVFIAYPSVARGACGGCGQPACLPPPPPDIVCPPPESDPVWEYSCSACGDYPSTMHTCYHWTYPSPCSQDCSNNSDCGGDGGNGGNGGNGNGNGVTTEPCMISYFELPARAWVGYSIIGRWAASDWCDDCDVTCTPYPECVWKQNNIGLWDEYKFKLSQSGTYNYTLTCYGPGGIDERQETATVQAINLPWWREIIPVLPGFLRGIWR